MGWSGCLRSSRRCGSGRLERFWGAVGIRQFCRRKFSKTSIAECRRPQTLGSAIDSAISAHDVLNFEDRYRDWLLRWYPKQSGLRIVVRTDDVLLEQRLAGISQTTGLEIICRGTHDLAVTPNVALTMLIPEDDRQFHVLNTHGQPVNSERLALALNRAMHTQSSHLTAHADAASNRFWLTDDAQRSPPINRIHSRCRRDHGTDRAADGKQATA